MQILVIGKSYSAKRLVEFLSQDKNNIIFTNSEINTTEIYKGQLYANITATEKKDVEYKTTSSLVILAKSIIWSLLFSSIK